MGKFTYAAPYCVFWESSDDEDQSPRAGPDSIEDLFFRRLEEGLEVRRPAAGASEFGRTLVRSLSATASIGLVILLLVMRYLYKIPELQDPLKMILFVILSLCLAVYFFIITKEDTENNT